MSTRRWGDIESCAPSLQDGMEHSAKNSIPRTIEYDEESTNVQHWGEIESHSHESYTPDVMEDIEKSMNKFCLAEFDTEYDGDHLQKSERLYLQAMDPLILYAISLHKYTNDLTEMIRVAELAIESHLIPPEDAVPPIPDPPEIHRKHTRNSLNYIPKDFTPFSLGEEIDVPELSEAVVKQILIKCVATLTAHIGFETTHQSVLDLLTDVLETFLARISQRLKIAREDEDNDQFCGFPNVAERVLIEMGMGGVAGLHDYYQARVVKYVNVLRNRCAELNDRYATLLVPKIISPTDIGKNKREKVIESSAAETENPEVHFSTIDGEVGLSLETGFQLLNSLEAEANLQSLAEGEEDISVNASPGILSIPETETSSNLSPFAKKKRNK